MVEPSKVKPIEFEVDVSPLRLQCERSLSMRPKTVPQTGEADVQSVLRGSGAAKWRDLANVAFKAES
eukprot:2995794-Rhodomonas_salina.1